MKRLTLSMIPVLCAAAAPLCAGYQGSKKAAPAKQPANQMYQMDPITPSANPHVTRWADPFLSADFIWWKAQEDGMDYAFNGAGSGVTNATKGYLTHPHSKYEPGFKVGFGLKFKHDGWDFYAQYTWLNVDKSDTRSSVTAATGGVSNVQSNMMVPNGGALSSFLASEATGAWSMHFNVLDLELGRNYFISKRLTMRPYVGMKFSWIDQDFDVNYITPLSPFAADTNLRIDQDLDQSAVGLRTGLDTAWYMANKWSIFGEFAVNGMWNDFDVSRKDYAITSTTTTTLNHVDRRTHSVSAVIEWALGLRFETSFHHNDYDFMLQAGWEEQVWFNQNQFVMMPNQSPADLNFEGLTIKAAFFF